MPSSKRVHVGVPRLMTVALSELRVHQEGPLAIWSVPSAISPLDIHRRSARTVMIKLRIILHSTRATAFHVPNCAHQYSRSPESNLSEAHFCYLLNQHDY